MLMKSLFGICFCLLLVLGCSDQAKKQTQIGFTPGGGRDDILLYLGKINATLLTNAPELLRAEFNVPETKKRMQVELGFRDGKLAMVTYIPQW